MSDDWEYEDEWQHPLHAHNDPSLAGVQHLKITIVFQDFVQIVDSGCTMLFLTESIQTSTVLHPLAAMRAVYIGTSQQMFQSYYLDPVRRPLHRDIVSDKWEPCPTEGTNLAPHSYWIPTMYSTDVIRGGEKTAKIEKRRVYCERLEVKNNVSSQ
ncbi:hypothetical protein KIN20_028145 [Parelaphostrongylus tenuis]|uniref:Uncharacterized protein n=1 Tax=Parelaphostrongylus tenuis TaxID=148309 RepID=A0AAD5R0L6_PARTN|nr:hypothetical protein KIN20_028145 [Parelaphostrongylus tenuis]